MHKCLLVLALALTFSLSVSAQSNLVITPDGGASNVTATAVTIGLNLTSTNGTGLIITNFFGWGTVDATNILANWQNIFTNTADQFGVAQTNLTALANNTP